MSQIKIYGLKTHLDKTKIDLSRVIHECVVEVLKMPADKRFHRFIGLDATDFIYPEDRSEAYTIIEVMMMTGRTEVTKKALIHALFHEISTQLNIAVNDLEICIIESPPTHWGFRGKTGDEIQLNYKVDL
ncbi:MAG TPA: tautomerase family protein [Microscillaceae bacterium]|nr:tautomerase family protein [Microscillaceae bacterium]